MALLHWSRSGVPVEDRAVVALLQRASAAIEPDPMYRRRLRGRVLNAHVARREGLVRARPQRHMGALGRSVLVASLTLAVSVSAVGAVSQDALPGDALYPVKRQLEAIRLQIATGAARDDLLAQALAERLSEFERLAAAGEWQLVDAAGEEVAVAEAAVLGDGAPATPYQRDRAQRHVARLEALLKTAPPARQHRVEEALQVARERASVTGRPADPPSAHPTPPLSANRPSQAGAPPTQASEPPGRPDQPGGDHPAQP